MRVGVGYSENPDSLAAGLEVAQEALSSAQQSGPCDLVLLFATARHNATALRKAVRSAVGEAPPIYGGGSVGAITNRRYGYAGDQVCMAAFWFEGSTWDAIVQPGLEKDEQAAGRSLGQSMAKKGATPETPVILLYDAIGMSAGEPRMVMATHLLKGIEEGLGFLPNINGAGLQGDHQCTQAPVWTGKGQEQHCALAMTFGGQVRVDSVIMHGCRPATGYYTVTKADSQTILEINGQPALSFIENLLGPSVPRASYPFFLLFGVSSGDKWEDFDETNYASRLCFGLDEKRNGIVMFEPDMVAGTEFQIMYRSLDLDYMEPRIENLFARLEGREPVFALYIDCAGRAAGYGGIDLEDAVVVQKVVNNRAPLLGIYTGVEIASVKNQPRGLDWTGVLCLFSVPK